ncbi:MAG: hypothetical protein JXA13_06260 [Anaerolineales bacterium]|nr:hypothetical protein [Anaerolineales bacterium]
MKFRLPLQLLFGLLIGFGIGLLYSWVISPGKQTDLSPAALRSDFKDQYRSVIAASFASTGNLERARARLALLEEQEPGKRLAAQAQRMIASEGDDSTTIQALALLANALQQSDAQPTNAPPPGAATTTPVPAEPASTPDTDGENTTAPQPENETGEESVPTLAAFYTPTPRPAPTGTPTPGVPFFLNEQETICDPALSEGLLQVVVLNTANKPVPGVKIVVNWNTGEEYFFTGLKPEIGIGYADFIMHPDIIYSLIVGNSTSPTTGLTPPVCQTTDGNIYSGSLRLSFRQQ